MWMLRALVLVLGVMHTTAFPDEFYPVIYCIPKLWQTERWSLYITHTDQGTDVKETVSSLSIDVTGQRLASRETRIQNGQPYSIFSLWYYPAQTMYVVHNGKCEERSLYGNFSRHCQQNPGNQYDEEMVFEMMGSAGPGPTDGVFTIGGRGVDHGVGYFYSIDNGRNIPLVSERHGVIDGVPTYTLDNYYNITLGIKDPSVFTPPENCVKVN